MIKLKVLVVNSGISYEDALKKARAFFEKKYCTDSFLPCPDKKAWHPQDKIIYTEELLESVIREYNTKFTYIIMSADPITVKTIQKFIDSHKNRFENSAAQYYLMSNPDDIISIEFDDVSRIFNTLIN